MLIVPTLHLLSFPFPLVNNRHAAIVYLLVPGAPGELPVIEILFSLVILKLQSQMSLLHFDYLVLQALQSGFFLSHCFFTLCGHYFLRVLLTLIVIFICI